MITPISRVSSLLERVDKIILSFSDYRERFEKIEKSTDYNNLILYSDSSNTETNDYSREFLNSSINQDESSEALYGVLKRFQAFRNELSRYPGHHYLFACDNNGKHYNNVLEYILLGIKYSQFEKMRLHIIDPEKTGIKTISKEKQKG